MKPFPQSIRHLLVVLAAFPVAGAVTTTVHAQSVPGLVVTAPPSDTTPTRRGANASFFRPPVTTAPATRGAKPEPKRQSKPRRKTTTRSAAYKKRSAPRRSGTSIVLLVNDDPITEYEVRQRAKLMALRADIKSSVQSRFRQIIKQPRTNTQLRAILKKTIEENRGKSRDEVLKIFERRKKAFAVSLQKRAIASARASVIPTFRKKAIEELTDERLKLHEAKRLKISVTDAQVNEAIARIASRNKTTQKKFEQSIRNLGVDFMTMRERIRAQLSWNNVIQARFSRLISINQQDIDEIIADQPTANAEDVKLTLHRLTLSLPDNFNQATLAKRISEAEAIQRGFKGCATTRRVAQATAGAQFEDLGTRAAGSIPEPTRSLLLNATNGQMAPPNTTGRGIELYAVCGRATAGATSLKAEAEARAKLRREEFTVLARRHLMDLRRDALIERR